MDKTQGFWIVIAGFVAILAALFFVVAKFTVATDVAAVLGPITTAIAGLGGASFGINLGQAGKAESDKQKDLAQKRAEFYVARLEPNGRDDVVKQAQALT